MINDTYCSQDTNKKSPEMGLLRTKIMKQLVSFAYFRINPPKSAATGALRLAVDWVDAFAVDNGFGAN